MSNQPSSKIIGAFVVGFALVAGAYTITNFGQTRIAPSTQPAAVQEVVPIRTPVVVRDQDNNGIEDWRDEFITTEPIMLNKAPSETYEPPDSLTGKLGINFTQNIVSARTYGPVGRSDEQIIEDTIDILKQETSNTLFDTPDITILRDWTDQDIVNYANAAALAISSNNNAELEHELFILNDTLNRQDESRLAELKALANVYKNTRDDTLRIPVPAFMAKEHLDLINTYHAIYHDIDAMAVSFDDPAYTFMRLKRYEEDALGLRYALQNMYSALEPHASLFTAEDPAVLFVAFNPNNQMQI